MKRQYNVKFSLGTTQKKLAEAWGVALNSIGHPAANNSNVGEEYSFCYFFTMSFFKVELY